jgi:hypothetical protein
VKLAWRVARVLLVLGAGPAFMGVSCSPASSPNGYWSDSCVSGDGRYLLAGGDRAVLVDLANGSVVERVPGMVKAVGLYLGRASERASGGAAKFREGCWGPDEILSTLGERDYWTLVRCGDGRPARPAR